MNLINTYQNVILLVKVCIVNSGYDLTTSEDIGLLHEHDVCTLQSSLCGFWHCHPYILLHFWKMFFILVCMHFLLYYSTIQEVVLL